MSYKYVETIFKRDSSVVKSAAVVSSAPQQNCLTDQLFADNVKSGPSPLIIENSDILKILDQKLVDLGQPEQRKLNQLIPRV